MKTNYKEKKVSEAAQIYEHEFLLVKKFSELKNNPPQTMDELLNEFLKLGNEYTKLLRQVIKITRIGDTNQKKLLLAKEQIEHQQAELGVAYKKMETLARTDSLTGLSNRRDFYDKFQNEINRFERNGKPFSIVLADIDNFKCINDQYGHDCGDFILEKMSQIMKSMIRKHDILARWGGEEFIMLLPESALAGGIRAAEEIRMHIENESFDYDEKNLKITITFGISEYDGMLSMDDCIKKADEALYDGKTRGKNCVCHSK